MQLWTAVSDFMCDYYTTFGADLGIVLEEELQQAEKMSFKEILEKATTDGDFRAKLLDKPVATLAGCGMALPEGFPLKFADGTDRTIYVPLPPFIGEVAGNDTATDGAMAQLMEKTASDRAFRDTLLAEPKETLRAEGFIIPESAAVVVLESTHEAFYAVLPPLKKLLPDGLAVDGTIITLHLNLDDAGVEAVKPVMMEWEGDMGLDLVGVEFISSSGIGLLLAVHKKLSAQGAALKMVNLQEPIRNVLVIARLDKLLNI